MNLEFSQLYDVQILQLQDLMQLAFKEYDEELDEQG